MFSLQILRFGVNIINNCLISLDFIIFISNFLMILIFFCYCYSFFYFLISGNLFSLINLNVDLEETQLRFILQNLTKSFARSVAFHSALALRNTKFSILDFFLLFFVDQV